MRMNDLPQGEKYIKSHRFHKRWHKVLMLLSSIVAFCTVYALILPAITMERECQLPEHTHTDAWYTQVSSVQKMVPVCTPEALEIHQHTAAVDTDVLTCTSTDADHVHTPRCYGTWVLTCGLEEHTHTDACYTSANAAEPESASDSAEGTLKVSLLYGDQEAQSSHPEGASYYYTGGTTQAYTITQQDMDARGNFTIDFDENKTCNGYEIIFRDDYAMQYGEGVEFQVYTVYRGPDQTHVPDGTEKVRYANEARSVNSYQNGDKTVFVYLILNSN